LQFHKNNISSSTKTANIQSFSLSIHNKVHKQDIVYNITLMNISYPDGIRLILYNIHRTCCYSLLLHIIHFKDATSANLLILQN